MYVVVQWARSVICHTIYFLPTAPQLNELFFPSFKFFLGGILHNLPNSARKTRGHDLSKMYWSCRRKRGSIFTFKWAAIRGGSKGWKGRWVLRITIMGGSTILHLWWWLFFVYLFIFIIIIISSLSIERKKHLKN